MANVAFIGLGVMGYPMAGHLSKAGNQVTVFNRTEQKATKWSNQFKGNVEKNPKEASRGKEFVFACVSRDNDLREVCYGENGIFEGMPQNSIFTDHSTVSEEVTLELAAIAKKKGIEYIDAPISGGQAGAESGALSIMCGGNENAFKKAEYIMQCYAKICRRMGNTGAGQLTKMVNQICIAGILQGLSEGLNFATKAGLDGNSVVEVISKGAAGSWQMDNRHETMFNGEFNFGFAVDWMRKDLGICLHTAEKIGASLPITAIIDQFYKDVQTLGGGRWDTSSLIKRLQHFD